MAVFSSGAFCGPEACVKVGEDVRERLQPDAQAHEVGSHARGDLLLLGQLRMCRCGRVNGQASNVADVGEMAEKLEALDEPTACLLAAFDSKGENRPTAVREVFELSLVPRARLEPRVADPGDLVTSLEPLGDLEGVRYVPFHADAQGLETLK